MTRAEFEGILTDGERALGVSFTLADRHGVFRTPEGDRLVGPALGSHQKHAVCADHFGPSCIAHCRDGIDARAAETEGPFVHRCWKGLCEIVFPLKRCDVLFGVLFAGLWRSGEQPPPEVPETVQRRWWRLPVLDPERKGPLYSTVAVFGRGLMGLLEDSRAMTFGPGERKATIQRFVHINAGRTVGPADLGRALNLSPSRAGHVVKEEFGCGLVELLTRERLLRARILLRGTDDRIRDVAAKAGFGDVCHFNRVFRKHVGCTPSAYRRDA